MSKNVNFVVSKTMFRTF